MRQRAGPNRCEEDVCGTSLRKRPRSPGDTARWRAPPSVQPNPPKVNFAQDFLIILHTWPNRCTNVRRTFVVQVFARLWRSQVARRLVRWRGFGVTCAVTWMSAALAFCARIATLNFSYRKNCAGVQCLRFRGQGFGFRFQVQDSGFGGTSGTGGNWTVRRVVRFGCGLGSRCGGSGGGCRVQDAGCTVYCFLVIGSACERKGANSKGIKESYLKAKASIWP